VEDARGLAPNVPFWLVKLQPEARNYPGSFPKFGKGLRSARRIATSASNGSWRASGSRLQRLSRRANTSWKGSESWAWADAEQVIAERFFDETGGCSSCCTPLLARGSTKRGISLAQTILP